MTKDEATKNPKKKFNKAIPTNNFFGAIAAYFTKKKKKKKKKIIPTAMYKF